MKVRSDYVSNSSSCSFIISAACIERASEAVDENLYGLDVPYYFEDDIKVFAYAKNKNVDELHRQLDPDSSHGADHYDGEDPEELSWSYVEMTVGGFIELMHKKDESTFKLIEQIEFSADDYGSGPIYLAELFKFFDRHNCKPNVDQSEREFICSSQTAFQAALRS